MGALHQCDNEESDMAKDETAGRAPTPVRVRLVEEPVNILKSWQLMRENVLTIIPDAATREKVISGKTATRWHMVMDPDAIQQILLERVEDYPKSTVTKDLLRPAIGESLFIAEGAHWRW